MIGLDLFFQFLKGRYRGNQFWAKFVKWPSFGRLVFYNGKEWQFQFKIIQWQYRSYIVCKDDKDWSSIPRDCEGNNCTFLDETAKIGISDQISQQLIDRSSSAFQFK